MGCQLITGYNIPCRTMGGIRELYIGNFIGDDISYIIASDTNQFVFSIITPYLYNGEFYSLYNTQASLGGSGVDTNTQVGDIVNITDCTVAYFIGTASVIFDSSTTGTGIVTNQIYNTAGSIASGVYFNSNESPSQYAKGTIIGINKPIDYYLFPFPQPKEVASLSTSGSFNEQNNTAFYTNIISMNFYELNQSNFDLFETLGKGIFMIMIQDNLGNYFLFGYDRGCRCVSQSIQTGKLYGDLNGATIQFQEKTFRIASQVSEEVALSLLSPTILPDLQLQKLLYPDFAIGILPKGITQPDTRLEYQQSLNFFNLNPLAQNYADISSLSGCAYNTYITNPFIDSLPLQNNPLQNNNDPVEYSILGTNNNYLIWSDEVSDAGTPIECIDILNNKAIYAPLVITNAENETLYSTLIADINMSLFTASSASIIIKFNKSHAAIQPIPELIPYQNFTTNWITAFTYSVDPIDNNAMYVNLNTIGTYSVGVRTVYDNATQSFPTSYRELIFQII